MDSKLKEELLDILIRCGFDRSCLEKLTDEQLQALALKKIMNT